MKHTHQKKKRATHKRTLQGKGIMEDSRPKVCADDDAQRTGVTFEGRDKDRRSGGGGGGRTNVERGRLIVIVM